jgi:hypothetical protein
LVEAVDFAAEVAGGVELAAGGWDVVAAGRVARSRASRERRDAEMVHLMG